MRKDNKFSKNERIKDNNIFAKILNQGNKYTSQKTIVFFLKNNLPYSRLGVSVSRQLKKAVVRNKLKRIAREVFRTNKDKLKDNFDIVILLRNYIKYQELKDFFLKTVCKA